MSSSSPPPLYSCTDTRVFWDVEDFPVPQNRNLCWFNEKVQLALEKEGYTGELSVLAFGRTKTRDERCHFARANIELVQEADSKEVRLHRLLLELYAWAFEQHASDRGNFLIVAKDVPEEDMEFLSVVQSLKTRGFNVFLAVPDDIPLEQLLKQDLPRTAIIVWRWTDLFDGKYPIEELDDSESESDSDSDSEEGTSQGAEKRQKITDA